MNVPFTKESGKTLAKTNLTNFNFNILRAITVLDNFWEISYKTAVS